MEILNLDDFFSDKNKSLRVFIQLFLICLFFAACAKITVQPRKYFVLEYKQVNEVRELFAFSPHNFTVRVVDTEISGTFNRRQIVVRASENQIMYDHSNLWADRLSNTLANLVQQRVSRYNIFNRVVRDFQQSAKYEIVTIVNALEYLQFGNNFGARLSIEYQFRRTSDNLTIFQHVADRSKLIYDDDVEMFIQSINDLLMEETDIFLMALNRYIHIIENEELDTSKNIFTSKTFLDEYQNTNFRLESIEDEQMAFIGRLFIPSKTDPEHEPLFTIEDEDHEIIGSFQMGTDVHLLPGNYFVLLGNGTIGQQVVEQVEVFPRYKTVLEPDVGWLTVNVIDNNRSQLDVRYEIFSLSNAESFGFGSGVKEGVGQQIETWVLRPGHYKIVLNGLPFNTYSDFATIELKKGELEQFTIVVDEKTNSLIGAGRMFYEEFISGADVFRVSIANHLNANFSSKNDMKKNNLNLSYTITEQLDTRIIFDNNPYHYTMSNLVEIGVTKEPETDLMISADKFDLKNTLVYYFINQLGFYARADINFHMFDEFIYTRDNKLYKVIDKQGIETISETNRFQTKNAIYPIVLREGLGLNYRVLNKNRANLNLRAGLGLRQDINKQVFNFEGTINNFEVYRELDSTYQKGTEFSANGNFQILRDLNYSLNADVLLPFDVSETLSYEWENILNLRMFKYLSWDYKLKLSYNKNLRDYILSDHSLCIRFTYIFVK